MRKGIRMGDHYIKILRLLFVEVGWLVGCLGLTAL